MNHDRARYTAGCRCDACRAANRDYVRAWRRTAAGRACLDRQNWHDRRKRRAAT
jgi:hypothetical protein